MSLKGTIETFAIADVLRLLAATNKSGRLHVEGPGRSGTVWVDAGQVLATEATNTPFVDGHNDVVFQLLRFDTGTFVFETDETPASTGEVVPIETALVSSEAMIDEWSLVEETVPTQDAWVTLAPTLSGDSVTLDGEKWRTVAAIGGGANVAAVGSTLKLGELRTGRLLTQLDELDLIDIGSPRADVSDPAAAAPVADAPAPPAANTALAPPPPPEAPAPPVDAQENAAAAPPVETAPAVPATGPGVVEPTPPVPTAAPPVPPAAAVPLAAGGPAPTLPAPPATATPVAPPPVDAAPIAAAVEAPMLPPIPTSPAAVVDAPDAPLAPVPGPVAPAIPDVSEAGPASVEAREQLDALATNFGSPADAAPPTPAMAPLPTPPVPPAAPSFDLDQAPPVPTAGLTTPASPPPAAPLGPSIPPSPVGAPPVPAADSTLSKARSIFDSADDVPSATPSLGEASGFGGADGAGLSAAIPSPPPPATNGIGLGGAAAGAAGAVGATGAAASAVGNSIDASDIAKQLANLSPKAAEAIKASTGLGGDDQGTH